MYSICDFQDIGTRKLLRNGARYVDFWKTHKGNIFKSSSTLRLRDCVKFASCQIIKQDKVDQSYQLIDIANVKAGYGSLFNLENNIVSEIGSDKVLLTDADLVFSKLNSHLGYVFLIEDVNQDDFEIIGSTEFFPLVVNKEIIHPKILKYILLHHVFRERAVFLRTGKSQSHPRIQRDDFFDLRIPSLDNKTQEEILPKLQKFENTIERINSKIRSLQEIIEEVLVLDNIKRPNSGVFTHSRFSTVLSSISLHKYLRIGARYNDFWNNFGGKLFDTNLSTKALKELITTEKISNLKKGALDQVYILIDFDQVSSPYGIINDFENYVSEIGSDKIIFGDCDILTNKLRPYLGYTILNIKDLNLIGTTEFIPMTVINKKVILPEYLRYILLTTEYLFKSQFLSSGKEHPRIYPIDLLNIKIPVPTIKIQEEIIEKIKEKEDLNNIYISRSLRVRSMLDRYLSTYLE